MQTKKPSPKQNYIDFTVVDSGIRFAFVVSVELEKKKNQNIWCWVFQELRQGKCYENSTSELKAGNERIKDLGLTLSSFPF